MQGRADKGRRSHRRYRWKEPRFVGIDVSKAQVDVAVRPTGKRWVCPTMRPTGPPDSGPGPALVLLEEGGLVAVRLRRCRWWWSTHARSGTSPGPPERWPRPTLWTRRSWPISPTIRPDVRPLKRRRDPGPQLADCPQAPGVDHAGLREEPAGYRHRRR